MTATVRLTSAFRRADAKRLIDRAPEGYVVTVREATRSQAQNDKLWAMLTDVARSRPGDRQATPDVWKALFMQACNHEQTFEIGLDGRPFPMGFRSSRLSKSEMADLITFILQWGDANGVRWSDEATSEAA